MTQNADYVPPDADGLIRKAVEHLEAADASYWEDDPEQVGLHIGYAQAAALTASVILQATQNGSGAPT